MLNIRTSTTRKYISQYDDAVDRKKLGKSTTWQRFVEGDVEIDKIPIRAGCKPSIFTLRRLSRAQFLHVLARPSVLEQSQEAVAYGLVGWENLGNGSTVRETEDTDLGPRMTEKCLDEIFYPELIKELGPVVIGMSMLGPTRERG